jgi:hypothetical protein
MRSGAAAKLKVEKIRMQRMSVERLGKGSKVERERRMNTPWHRINSKGTAQAFYYAFHLSDQVLLRGVV